jgi:hypothetical protein
MLRIVCSVLSRRVSRYPGTDVSYSANFLGGRIDRVNYASSGWAQLRQLVQRPPDVLHLQHGSRQAFVRTNPTGTSALITELKETGSPTDNAALVWAQDMVMLQQQLRPTATSLIGSITSADEKGGRNEAFCGICCASRDNVLSYFDELEIADTK